MKGKIRLAKRKDSERILELINDNETFKGSCDESWTMGDLKEMFLDKMYELFVIEIDKQVVGSLILNVHRLANHLCVHILVVDASFRGNGIGGKLLEFAEKFAKKNKIHFIWGLTEVDNKPMKSLFKKIKFGEGKKFYFYSKKL